MPRFALTLLVLALSGCVTNYQPLSGAHRPVAVDLRGPNLRGVAVTLRCLPDKRTSRADASLLCRKVARLFENQGAVVTTSTNRQAPDPDEGASNEGTQAGPKPAEALEIELTSRRIHQESTSFLFFEYVSDYTFVQDIVVRDEAGALLARERIVGRFYDTFGFDQGTEVTFSRQFYGSLSQIALNARMRRKVLAQGR